MNNELASYILKKQNLKLQNNNLLTIIIYTIVIF